MHPKQPTTLSRIRLTREKSDVLSKHSYTSSTTPRFKSLRFHPKFFNCMQQTQRITHARPRFHMMTCFNPRPPAPSSRHWEDLSAVKRRFVAIRRQPEGVLRLEVGFRSRTGRDEFRGDRANQDAIAIVLPLPDPVAHCSLFAVFDGHGRGGEKAAAFVAQRLVRELHHAIDTAMHFDPEDALRRACVAVDEALRNESGMDLAFTGTTATVCLVNDTEVTCANIGDSRIVLASYDPNKKVVDLTEDHVPSRPDEKKRIELAGGRVDTWAPGGLDTGPARVYLSTRRVPGLAVSRAFGDAILDGIINAEPDISTVQLRSDHSFIIVASDGIWSQMSSKEVVDFVSRRRTESPQRVAEYLVKHATNLWEQSEDEAVDDISVILIYLHWHV